MSEDIKHSFTAAQEGIEQCAQVIERCKTWFRVARIMLMVAFGCATAATVMFLFHVWMPAISVLMIGVFFYAFGWELGRYAKIRLDSENRFLDTYKAMLDLVGLRNVKT